jgi:hypothetical protein
MQREANIPQRKKHTLTSEDSEDKARYCSGSEQARQAQIAHTALKLPPSSTQYNLLISFLDRTNFTITDSQTKQFLLAKHEKWPKQEKTHTQKKKWMCVE